MNLFTPQHKPISLRPYQREAVDAVYRHLRERDDNPCVVLPTGSGKSVVISQVCSDAAERWNGRVLVLAHVKELLEQAADKLRAVAPSLDLGVYSAGLGRRDTGHAVIVAGIQSVFRRAGELGRFDLVIVDEAHMIPPDGDGMYQAFLQDARALNPHLRVIGLTATPFRMTTGPICTPPPEGTLNAVCYEAGVRELIAGGYLSPLRSKAGVARADFGGLHVRGGEFVAGEVEELMDHEILVHAACHEIIEQTRDRQSCLVFAAGVEHGRHVATAIERVGGVECGFVDGQTPTLYRDQLIGRFRDGGLKYLVNVNVLTTGFDAPGTDCVALLRPTMSPGLYYQMVGRGFRPHPGKADCLVLDFGGNVLRHGPVDALRITEPGTRGESEAPAKECPECHALIATGYARCPDCGHEFPPPERRPHDAVAGAAGVLSGQATTTEYPVRSVYYSVHMKRDAPPDAPRTLRVDYEVGYHQHKSEWVCLEHPRNGYARQKAEAWWRRRSRAPVPETIEQAVELADADALAPTLGITVRAVAGEKYERIVGYELGDIPAASDDGEWDRASTDPDYIAIPDDEVPF